VHVLYCFRLQDMLMVAEHLLQLPNGPQELVVIGYSYGACIAANLMEHVPQVCCTVKLHRLQQEVKDKRIACMRERQLSSAPATAARFSNESEHC
jgi:dienelactone hydrolase